MTRATPRRLIAIAAIAVAAFVVITPAARVDAKETGTRATKAERVAEHFLDAYGDYDAKRALKYLAEEGLASGSGHTTAVWVTPDGFRSEVAMTRAQRIKQHVIGCEEQGASGNGVAVQCAFDFHGFRSD